MNYNIGAKKIEFITILLFAYRTFNLLSDVGFEVIHINASSSLLEYIFKQEEELADEIEETIETSLSSEIDQSDEYSQLDEVTHISQLTSIDQINESNNAKQLDIENFVSDTNKLLLNREECIPRAGEIIVCADKDVNTRYRIEKRYSLRDLPRNQRSWVDGVDRLQDESERSRIGSFSSNGYFGGSSQSIKNLRDYCEQGASKAKKKNAQSLEISKISQNQSSAPPKRVKGPCEP